MRTRTSFTSEGTRRRFSPIMGSNTFIRNERRTRLIPALVRRRLLEQQDEAAAHELPIQRQPPVFMDEEVDPDFSLVLAAKKKFLNVICSLEAEGDKRDSLADAESERAVAECAVCLLPLELPIQLECSHQFCLTCTKGMMRRSSACALCRRQIPDAFVTHPEKFAMEVPHAPVSGHFWFYKSRLGWWTYAPRLQAEIEDAFQSGNRTLEFMFNGQQCTVVFDRRIQIFGDRKVQQITRSWHQFYHVGVAGLAYSSNVA